MIHNEALSSLEKLHQLKVAGVITEEEFEQSKAKILSGERGTSTNAGFAIGQNELIEWIKIPLKRYADFNGRPRRK